MPPKDQPDWLAATIVRPLPYDWTGVSDPGALTRANVTVSRAASSRPLLGSVVALLWISVAGSAAHRVNVWDGGETGAILWTTILAVPSQGVADRWVQSDLAISVTNTIGLTGVITVSFDAAPVAGVNQIISIGGWDG